MTTADRPTVPETDWIGLAQRTVAAMELADPIYRPTQFWQPIVTRLMGDMEMMGFDRFKSWPSARTMFNPAYGGGLTPAMIKAVFSFAGTLNPDVPQAWLTSVLAGAQHARRDFDAARLTWDQGRWPMDLEGLGESQVGKPPQRFYLMGAGGPGWTRAYLNYLLCLAALSRHVDAPPRRFLEIGGGYGVLGEIVMSRDPDACYVDLDLPPLTTVASFYLRTLFGDRVTIADDTVAETEPIELAGSACLPNWRIGDVAGPFDVFVNSFSFQEMEPDVVEAYVREVAAKDVAHVVSLNSVRGKDRAAAGAEFGVIDPVTSDRIVAMFEGAGYVLLERHRDPLIQSNGEIVILRRAGLTSRPAPPLAVRSGIAAIDYRTAPVTPAPTPKRKPERPPSRSALLARALLPAAVLRRLRRRRRGRR